MRKLILFVFFSVYTVSSFAQVEIKTLTAKQVYDLIQQSDKASVVKFWVPNCANNVEIVKDYKELISKYGKKIDFYLMGITAKEELVQELIHKTDFTYPLYIINVEKDISLIEKRSVFEEEFLNLFNMPHQEFITVYISEDRQIEEISTNIEHNNRILNKFSER